jgi:ABC-type multidrug transport system fused ATPase/permease subunit
MKYININNIIRLVGSPILILIGASVPLGLAIGFAEIALGASVYGFLVQFGYVSGDKSVIPLPDANPTMLLITVALGVAVLRFAASLAPSIGFEMFNTRIRNALANQALSGYREELSLPVATVSHILTNLGPKTAGFLNSWLQVMVVMFTLTTIFAGLFVLSTQLMIISIVTGLFASVPILLLKGKFQKFSSAVYANTRRYTEGIIKDLKNVLFLKISGANEIERNRLLELSRNALKNHKKYIFLFSLNASLPPFFAIVAVVVVIVANVRYSFLSVAGLVPFVYLLSRMAAAIAQLASAIAQIQFGKPFYRELQNYRPVLFSHYQQQTGTSDRVPINDNLDADIRVSGLTIGRDAPLVMNLDLKAKPGEMLLISGPSGRGKTTLLLTLVGIIDRLDGEIYWSGQSLDDLDPSALRRLLGYAGPDPYLIDGTVRDNLLFGATRKDIPETDLHTALDCACASFVSDLEGGIDHILKEDGDGVSAGQKQRLSIARALLRRPAVLILDEAMANIDEPTEQNIVENIKRLHPDMIMVAVSHRSSMRKFATTEIVL